MPARRLAISAWRWSTSLLASLGVALFLIPMLASRAGMSWTEAAPAQIHWREFASWRALGGDWRRLRRPRPESGLARRLLRWAAFPFVVLYLGLRFVVGALLEVVGKLLMGLFFGLLLLGRRVLGPALGKVFGLLAHVPVRLTQRSLDGLHDGYPRGLRWALANPLTMLLVVVASFALTGWMLLRLDTELLPEVHQGEFTVEVALPVGTPLEETVDVVSPVEDAILAEKGAIESLLLTVGYDAAYSNRSDEGEHTARFKVLLDRADPRTEDEVVRRLRARFAAIPDLDVRVTRPVLFSFRTPIEVEVHGDDLLELRRQAERVRQTLAAMPQLADVETTQRRGSPEVQVVYDRELLARYGLNPGEVASSRARQGAGVRGDPLQPQGPPHPDRRAAASWPIARRWRTCAR